MVNRKIRIVPAGAQVNVNTEYLISLKILNFVSSERIFSSSYNWVEKVLDNLSSFPPFSSLKTF
jgi:hypothetical protein